METFYFNFNEHTNTEVLLHKLGNSFNEKFSNYFLFNSKFRDSFIMDIPADVFLELFDLMVSSSLEVSFCGLYSDHLSLHFIYAGCDGEPIRISVKDKPENLFNVLHHLTDYFITLDIC